jgi:hypothetical protein
VSDSTKDLAYRNLLTRAALSAEQWAAVRDAPHLVVFAVSGASGSPLDLLLERAAGRAAIASGINSDHPLVRAIAERAELDVAAALAEEIAIGTYGPLRPPAVLMEFAIDALRRAVAVLREHGAEPDRCAYREFVLGVAHRVARAAREGDFLGFGGQRVSDAERAALIAFEQELG